MGVADYIGAVVALTVIEVFILFGPAMAVGFLMHHLSDYVRNTTSALVGRNAYIYFTFLGVVTHELGHAVFCPPFGHKITDMRLFSPRGNTLGYVNHSYNPKNPWHAIGNFFIGTGPLWIGSAVIFALGWIFIPSMRGLLRSVNLSLGEVGNIKIIATLPLKLLEVLAPTIIELFSPHNFTRLQFYIFLYLAFSIGSHVTLSPPDIKGALSGFCAILLTLLIVNFATFWIGDGALKVCVALARLTIAFTAVMLVPAILNCIAVVILWCIIQGRR